MTTNKINAATNPRIIKEIIQESRFKSLRILSIISALEISDAKILHLRWMDVLNIPKTDRSHSPSG